MSNRDDSNRLAEERDRYRTALLQIAERPNYPAKAIADEALAEAEPFSSKVLRMLEAGNELAAVVADLVAGSDEEGRGARALIVWQHAVTAMREAVV